MHAVVLLCEIDAGLVACHLPTTTDSLFARFRTSATCTDNDLPFARVARMPPGRI
jgi:hypothetical protein